MAQRVNRFIYWAPRILSILFLLFMAFFSLDIFDEKLGFWGTVLGLFMHNIPVFVLLAVLLVAWRHEIVGAAGFIFAGLLYIFWVIAIRHIGWPMVLEWSALIAGPAFLVGILFLANWFKKK